MGDYLIVGGGITGLAAAWEASGRGHRVSVVEESARLGGKVRSEVRSGCLVEHGPDSFVTYRPAVLELVAELGMSDQVISVTEPRVVNLRVRGRMQPLPDGMGLVLPTRLAPFARTRIISWPQKARAGLDLVLPRVLSDADMAIGEILRRRLGPAIVASFADPLLGGLYGTSVDELSIDAVLPSLRSSEAQHRSLMLASLAQGRAARGRPPGSPFRSLQGGMGSLVDALSGALSNRQVELRTGVQASGLRLGRSGLEVELGDGTFRRPDGVVLACGARPAADLVDQVSPEAASGLRSIPHRSTAVVTLGFHAEAFRDAPIGHGYLEAGPQWAPVSGVTLSSNKWAGRAPQGVVLLRAFVPDRVGPLGDDTDERILEAVVDHIGKVLGAPDPHLRHIVRWRDCMPSYVVGHRQRVLAVERALRLVGPVRVAGSAVNGVGVPDCIADGRRVAAELAGA
ncbi:MAG: protoporphyrinogen oxidase [Candidatus Nanopelagicales bacterium]